MNTPNPLVPQGSIQSKGKSTVRIAFFTIAAVHVVFIGGLLMQGCKKSETQPVAEQTNAAPEIPQFPVDNNTFTNPTTEQTNVEVATNVAPPTNVDTTQIPPAPEPVPPQQPVAPEPVGHEYVVTKGDTFSSIAKKFGVSVKAITAANPSVNPSRLQIGQKLQVPAGASVSSGNVSSAPSGSASSDTTTYVVKSGDMLDKIARRNGTTAKAIMRLNNLKTTTIKVGQKLKLPASKSSSTSNAEPVATPGYVTPLPSNSVTTP